MKRTFDEISKARQLPQAVRIRKELNGQIDVLDDLRFRFDYEADKLTFLQFRYKIVTQGFLTKEEHVSYKAICLKHGFSGYEDLKYEVEEK